MTRFTRLLTLTFALTAAALSSACSAARPLPVVPTLVRQPVAQPLGFRTSSGLLGEEVELSGIYAAGRSGAQLLLRSGEQLSLGELGGRPLRQLPGLEDRSNVRIRGRLLDLGAGRLGLEVKQAIRI